MHQVREINDIHDLAEFGDTWQELLSCTPGATFFQSLPWLQTYWQHYGHNQKLRVLMILEDQQLVGIVPLVVRRDRKFFAGRCRKLTYPLDGWSSYYGPVGPDPRRLLATALRHVRATRRDWDLVDLGWSPAAQHDVADTERLMQQSGMSATCQVEDDTAVVDLDGTWDEYLATRTSKWRNNYRRWQRRLSEQGEIRYVRHRPASLANGDGNPGWDLYETCEQIAASSWQGTSENGTTLSHKTVQPFLRDVHSVAARGGSVDLNLLYVGETPVAFAYGYHFQGNVFGLRIGHDAGLGRLGAGNLLYTLIIQDNFARGDHLYDLGPGSLDIKRHLMTRSLPVCRYTHYHPIAAGAHLVRAKRWASELRLAWPTSIREDPRASGRGRIKQPAV